MISDVSVDDNANLLKINVRHTKTIQFGQRVLTVPIAHVPGSVMCPYTAVMDMLVSVSSIHPNGTSPLFCFIKPNGVLSHLTHTSFVQLLKKILTQAGYDAALYSGHSFRRGGCTFSFKLGVSPTLIKLRGDWKSNAFERYISIDDAQHVSFAKALGQASK